MAKRLSAGQRREILALLAQGQDRKTIAARVGVTLGQVSAINAHVTMGTYELNPNATSDVDAHMDAKSRERTAAVLDNAGAMVRPDHTRFERILIGKDAESSDPVYWNPDPSDGAANPHVLVLGESGFGKTYAICCLLTELAQRGITSVIFDYAQGFSLENAPSEFVKFSRPVELDAARDGININPLQSYPFDLHGPVSVAQRVADTFRRVYPGIGIQQHAILREAVLDVLGASPRISKHAKSHVETPPPFGELQQKLQSYADDPTHPN